MLRVRFGGFSALKITKGLKANWVDKLAHFGGTAGLFTGVSYIFIFELVMFILSFLPYQSKKNEVKISKDVEAKKFEFKECENENKDLKKK